MDEFGNSTASNDTAELVMPKTNIEFAYMKTSPDAYQVLEHRFENQEPFSVKDIYNLAIITAEQDQSEKMNSIYGRMMTDKVLGKSQGNGFWDEMGRSTWITADETQRVAVREFVLYLSDNPGWRSKEACLNKTMEHLQWQEKLISKFESGNALEDEEFEYWLALMAEGYSPDLLAVREDEISWVRNILDSYNIKAYIPHIRKIVLNRKEGILKIDNHPFTDQYGDNKYIASLTNSLVRLGLELKNENGEIEQRLDAINRIPGGQGEREEYDQILNKLNDSLNN